MTTSVKAGNKAYRRQRRVHSAGGPGAVPTATTAPGSGVDLRAPRRRSLAFRDDGPLRMRPGAGRPLRRGGHAPAAGGRRGLRRASPPRARHRRDGRRRPAARAADGRARCLLLN